jgi:hypothetical protein
LDIISFATDAIKCILGSITREKGVDTRPDKIQRDKERRKNTIGTVRNPENKITVC